MKTGLQNAFQLYGEPFPVNQLTELDRLKNTAFPLDLLFYLIYVVLRLC